MSTRCNEQRPGRSASGVALVGVLWGMTLLSLMAAALAAESRDDTRLATHLIAAAQARHAAEGAIYFAIAELAQAYGSLANPLEKYSGAGTQEMRVGDSVVQLTIHDEAARVDLNSAEPALLEGLLRTADISDEQRRRVLDAVLDWRDRDSVTRRFGMEDAEYLAAGSPYGAKDGPFDSVDELQLVAGMTRDLYRMLRPSLTVHSGQSGVNASDASLTVLLALGAERKAAEDYIERRAARMPGQAAPPVPVRTLKFVSRSSSSVFRIHAAARTASGAAADVTAIVDLRPQADQEEPYTLRDWRHEPARMSSSPGGTP